MLLVSGVLCFVIAFFQMAISFSPSLSLYFGAPEVLTSNMPALVLAGFAIAGILVLFGFYALSGAGSIRVLPWLKPALAVISAVFILRGLLVVPEALVVMGAINSSVPIEPRFVLFSSASLVVGLFFSVGTVGRWRLFPSKTR